MLFSVPGPFLIFTEETLTSINTVLKKPGIRRIPIKVKNYEDIIQCAINIHSESIVPIFLISNVTMEGIENLHKFLNIVPKKCISRQTLEIECHLDTAWTVPGIGTVVGGHLVSGSISVGDKLWFGPNNNKYIQIIVKSIHCKKVSIQKTLTHCYICIAVKGISKQDVYKGNVLLGNLKQQILCENIIADVEVLQSHSTTIKVGYQPIIHAHNVRTSVTIIDIINKISARNNDLDTDKVLRTGDSAELHLKLCFGKQFIKPGTNILLCEGRTKVIGCIKKIY